MDVAPGPVSLATRETPATQGLLIIVAAFWLATLACGGADFTPALVRLGAQVPAPGEPWRLWSYAFLHGSWAHVGMNAYVLWRIGRPLERLLGTARFVVLYSLTALAGGLATSLTLRASRSALRGHCGDSSAQRPCWSWVHDRPCRRRWRARAAASSPRT